jgi:hypothetical protein
MSSLSREQLQTRLDAYLAAETKVLQAQEYVIGQGATARRLTRADLPSIQKGIQDTRDEIARLDASTIASGRRIMYLRPR